MKQFPFLELVTSYTLKHTTNLLKWFSLLHRLQIYNRTVQKCYWDPADMDAGCFSDCRTQAQAQAPSQAQPQGSFYLGVWGCAHGNQQQVPPRRQKDQPLYLPILEIAVCSMYRYIDVCVRSSIFTLIELRGWHSSWGSFLGFSSFTFTMSYYPTGGVATHIYSQPMGC